VVKCFKKKKWNVKDSFSLVNLSLWISSSLISFINSCMQFVKDLFSLAFMLTFLFLMHFPLLHTFFLFFFCSNLSFSILSLNNPKEHSITSPLSLKYLEIWWVSLCFRWGLFFSHCFVSFSCLAERPTKRKNNQEQMLEWKTNKKNSSQT
jgi:hypothetical protein